MRFVESETVFGLCTFLSFIHTKQFLYIWVKIPNKPRTNLFLSLSLHLCLAVTINRRSNVQAVCLSSNIFVIANPCPITPYALVRLMHLYALHLRYNCNSPQSWSLTCIEFYLCMFTCVDFHFSFISVFANQFQTGYTKWRSRAKNIDTQVTQS